MWLRAGSGGRRAVGPGHGLPCGGVAGALGTLCAEAVGELAGQPFREVGVCGSHVGLFAYVGLDVGEGQLARFPVVEQVVGSVEEG